MHGLEPLIPVAFFFSVAAILILRGPLGRALGERIAAGGSAGRMADEVAASQRELAELRARLEVLEELVARVQELEERLDFAERLLVRQGERPKLGGGI